MEMRGLIGSLEPLPARLGDAAAGWRFLRASGGAVERLSAVVAGYGAAMGKEVAGSAVASHSWLFAGKSKGGSGGGDGVRRRGGREVTDGAPDFTGQWRWQPWFMRGEERQR